MKKFSAHWVFPISSPPIPYGIITTDDDGTIVDVRETNGTPVEEAQLQFYPGILIPGMVNAHCHLELSHLKGVIQKQLGLTGFVGELTSIRYRDPGEILHAAQQWDRIMWQQGISAVGDISNTTDTLIVKKGSPIHYHTFVEVFSLLPEKADQVISKSVDMSTQFRQSNLDATLTPHAPYSITSRLWEALRDQIGEAPLISIHHDESQAELDLLTKRDGALAERFRSLEYNLDHIPPEASDSLRLLNTYLPGRNYLFVHNTFTTTDTPIDPNNCSLCFCPKANLYIENQLPDIPALRTIGTRICIGTDSLASNDSLSLVEEMVTIQQAFPEISLDEILSWATLNGAGILGLEDQLGSFEPGKKPGVVHIDHVNWENWKLGELSRAVRLI